MAPEIFNNDPYTLKADVYSFGIVLWEIASRCPPYTNMKNPQALMKYITIENGRPDLTLIDNECPNELKALMIRCWDKQPSNRPSFA
jgi:mitogen-activated protein kinase kinase kinase 7